MYQEAADLVTQGLAGSDIHVTPKDIKVYNGLSNMLREQVGDGEGALAYALKAIEHEPNWENGHHSKAKALVHLGRLEQAKKAFEKALQLNPTFAAAHSNYGDCLQKLGLIEQAEKSYRRSLHLESNSTISKFRLAALISTTAVGNREAAYLLEAEQL